MNCAINGIGVDRFKIRLIFSGLVSNPAIGVKHDKFIFIALVLYQNRIIDLCEENGYFKPEICFRELPALVDQHYMAKKAEIEQAACKNLNDIEQNKDYLKLLAIESKLSDEQQKSVSYSAVLGYVNHLKSAICTKDYVAIRRYSNGLWVIDSIVQCLERIEKIIDTVK